MSNDVFGIIDHEAIKLIDKYLAMECATMAEEQAILSAGTLVRERYMIKGVLGSGSTGMLYLVKDQKDPAPQAPFLVLKEISGLDQQARFDFTIRGTALHQLKHPALPRIHALLNDDKRGCIYLVMDYVDGERLTHVPWGHLNWLELRTWCEPLIAALSYLHHQEQPLFHGDLKPENIVRHSSKKIMLVEPGYIQPRSADQSRPGNQRQPDCYRAPEQFAGMLDERSDVYGCGALLYTLLSGEEPVDALTRRERVKRKKSDPLVPPHKLAPHLSRELAAVLLRALALDPAARFASVREFWEALLPLTTVLETPRSAAQKNIQPAASGSGVPSPTGQTPTEPRRAAALPPGIAPVTPVPPVYSPPRPRRQSMSHFQRLLFPISAGAVALLILLMGAGAWAWGAVHQTNPQKIVVTATPGAGSATQPLSIPLLPEIIEERSGLQMRIKIRLILQ
jgi:serine/threonine-protein kinase